MKPIEKMTIILKAYLAGSKYRYYCTLRVDSYPAESHPFLLSLAATTTFFASKERNVDFFGGAGFYELDSHHHHHHHHHPTTNKTLAFSSLA
jgi:hypothetical protein